jgi:hypothetical protein
MIQSKLSLWAKNHGKGFYGRARLPSDDNTINHLAALHVLNQRKTVSKVTGCVLLLHYKVCENPHSSFRAKFDRIS